MPTSLPCFHSVKLHFLTRQFSVLFTWLSWQIRSEIIATYALCGFANFSSIGIQIGGMGPLAPSRKTDMAKVAIRALVAGTIACFMTACIAGEMFNLLFVCLFVFLNQTDPFWNYRDICSLRVCQYGLYGCYDRWAWPHGPKQNTWYIQGINQGPCCWDYSLLYDCVYCR